MSTPSTTPTAASIGNWKQLLLNALNSNSHLKHSSYFQLATVGPNGAPSNRTVVFRGFQENSDKIQIHTDLRSRKIEELRHNPLAEVISRRALIIPRDRANFSLLLRQHFRINGSVEVLDASNANRYNLQLRENAWHSCSVRSRQQYLGPTPGLPCLHEMSTGSTSLDPSRGPVEAFCLLVLDPDQVDYLNLKRNERLLFTSIRSATEGKCWNSERINP